MQEEEELPCWGAASGVQQGPSRAGPPISAMFSSYSSPYFYRLAPRSQQKQALAHSQEEHEMKWDRDGDSLRSLVKFQFLPQIYWEALERF